MPLYTGVCHCKAHKYTILLPATITEKAHFAINSCTCSFCSLNGIQWAQAQPEAEKIAVLRDGPLTKYSFATRNLENHFCSTCGILVRAKNLETGGTSYNARLLEDVEPWTLKTNVYEEGATSDPQHVNPPFSGPPFQSSPGHTLYHGSCHCGAVAIALRQAKRLEEQTIIECNCSFCWRTARIHAYPDTQDVRLSGATNLTSYAASSKLTAQFCKTCGTQMLMSTPPPVWHKQLDENDEPEPGDEVVEDPVAELGYEFNVCAVNVRVLHSVDIKTIRARRFDGRALEPAFVAE